MDGAPYSALCLTFPAHGRTVLYFRCAYPYYSYFLPLAPLPHSLFRPFPATVPRQAYTVANAFRTIAFIPFSLPSLSQVLLFPLYQVVPGSSSVYIPLLAPSSPTQCHPDAERALLGSNMGNQSSSRYRPTSHMANHPA